MRTPPTVLLFGSTGQVGSALVERLSPVARIVIPQRSEADFTHPTSLATVVERVRPAVVINAAAYTAVDRAEAEASLAMTVNAEAPDAIARAAKRVGALVVHFSTDYVFDGRKALPYVETDVANPLGVYGRSKLAGDRAIASAGVPHLIFRTSWVYALHGRNFLRAIESRARETGELRVVNDQIGAPTFAAAIAEAVVDVLRGLLAAEDTFAAAAPVSGVYHLSAHGSTTWHAFALAILERMGIRAEVTPISTAEFGAAAPRPLYSVLDNTKLERTFGLVMPEWRALLDRALDGVR